MQHTGPAAEERSAFAGAAETGVLQRQRASRRCRMLRSVRSCVHYTMQAGGSETGGFPEKTGSPRSNLGGLPGIRSGETRGKKARFVKFG